jgi:DNA-binding transcriptional LysR family regulator
MSSNGSASGEIANDVASRPSERRKPELDAKLLRTFVTIVELRSFTRAGRRLGLSQSAISQQISLQERLLDKKLLVRAGNGVRPTAAGELLLHFARQILQKMDEAQRVLTAYEANGNGLLRIGAGGAICEHLLPGVLEIFHRDFPRVELRVQSGTSQVTIERLLHGELDVGLIALPVEESRLRVFELGRSELVVVVDRAHKWAARRRVEPRELGEQALVVYDRRSATYRTIERVLLEGGAFPRIAMETDHLSAVPRMVLAGVGMAVLPRWATREELSAGRLVGLSIGTEGLFQTWGLAIRADDHQPQTLRALVRLCVERLPPLLGSSAPRPGTP